MTGLSFISVNDVSFSYRVKQGFFRHRLSSALRNISFDVNKGETLGILGNNGSGKSTLLRVIAGIYSVDSGSVFRRTDHVSLVSLNMGMDPELSGRSNAIFGSMLQGAKRADAIAMLGDIKAFSELGEAFDDPIKTYSSGMVSRLAFAVAYYSKSDVMLLDEILSVGDPSFRDKAYLAMSQKIAAATTVLVSHDLSEVERLCDRVLLLEDGQIVAEGQPPEVISNFRQRRRA